MTTTTTTIAPSSTTTSSSSTTTSTVIPANFVAFETSLFRVRIPDTWVLNPDFPTSGAGFLEDHIALGLPPSDFSISLDTVDPDFDLEAHFETLLEDRAAFVPNFQLLRQGTGEVDSAPSIWFEYTEVLDGFDIVHREEVAVLEDTLTTFSLFSPAEFFEFDAEQAQLVIETYARQ